MPLPLDCPGRECWQALLDLTLPPDQLEHCERHLESCPACQERLHQAEEGDDALLRVARQTGDPTVVPPDPTLDRILERLHEASCPQAGGSPEPTDLSFLDPTDQPELLGMLGGYEVREVIGQGGFGIVLAAYEPALHRVVAIKVLSPALAGSATARRRFTREAKAAAAVCHDHIVAVHGVHDAGGLPYLVMQYVAGESLETRLRRGGPLEVEEVVRIGLQTASGLAAAHAQGLIHRDVKPANLLLENGLAKVKITDFGLARMVDDVGPTRDGVVAGTPEYMAPEQARGEAVDHRADLFSLGCVLYACCTGQSPFRGSTTLAILRRVCEEEQERIRSLNPAVPAWLEALVAGLLEKDPANRIQSAAEVVALLEGYLAHLHQPAAFRAPRLPLPAGTGRGRARSGRKGWLLALVLMAAALPVLLLFQAGPPPAPAPSGEFYQDFRAGQQPAPPLELVGADAGVVARAEEGGFRITLPGDRKKRDRVSLVLRTRFKGDFEITSGYEILQVGQPVEGHGVAFALLVRTDTPRDDVVELTRAARAEQGEVYNCARISTDDQGKRNYHHEFPPAADNRGRLRLSRRGGEVTLSAAEGPAGEFNELSRLDLGTEDVITVNVGAFGGFAPNQLDLRILDLRVHTTGAADTSSPQRPPAGQGTGGSRGSLAAAGIIALLLLLSALVVWLAARSRHRTGSEQALQAPPGPEPAPAADPPSLSFACSACGKKLKGKWQLAGKAIHCPACQATVRVPGTPGASTQFRAGE
jgi:hypothetical protein